MGTYNEVLDLGRFVIEVDHMIDFSCGSPYSNDKDATLLRVQWIQLPGLIESRCFDGAKSGWLDISKPFVLENVI